MININEEITLKVPLDVAQAYRQATEEEQQQIVARLAVMVRSPLARVDAVKKLSKTMDDISKEAQANGLTPEILESILNDDE